MRRERLIDLPKVIDRRGNLSFIEADSHVPFSISRVYWIYDVPGGQTRGSHAFKSQHEVIIALSGSFDVLLDDGKEQRTYSLNRSYKGLYIPNMMWRSLTNFSTNSLCLVIASEAYNEEDYIRNYKIFQKLSLSDAMYNTFPPSKCIEEDSASQYNTVFDCTLLEFPIIKNRAGNITPVHSNQNIPFAIERIFYIYDIPSGVKRGMHAHKYCHEVLIATSGSFEVELDDGTNKRTVLLNNPMIGLYIPPGVWATEKEYSSGAICLALASEKYKSEDYINTYSDFKKYRQNGY
ncbi:WxcM-like domain-containing protein [Dysgonomonas sp. Marseille-P4677]|uniref:sugar 3,4-ketoisomerase n=1 Tax=Dysgonomonas sp. Marseille-P4677 TaxID=2364790 RepID=UPI00191461D4|nr:FdtA/QdtA family cupin domain-containing protein [Dysgonomonas sp. Marseille-P4677]MBK5720604.1 WxcM-like domain-containing protein [Dysgonomonas sp. Marseille-P4677]